METTEARAPERRWLTTREAAEYCAVDPVTLWRARQAGRLKVGGAGRAVRYHCDDLDRWLRGETAER